MGMVEYPQFTFDFCRICDGLQQIIPYSRRTVETQWFSIKYWAISHGLPRCPAGIPTGTDGKNGDLYQHTATLLNPVVSRGFRPVFHILLRPPPRTAVGMAVTPLLRRKPPRQLSFCSSISRWNRHGYRTGIPTSTCRRRRYPYATTAIIHQAQGLPFFSAY